ILLALGGGVTGDLVGFVAASLHRGIPLIHLPTSIIAQVDSSIGGKVGINHPRGKNLLGNFHQASAVFIHPQFLQTLPEIEFINGMAEVIKYAVTLDATLWDLLEAEHGQILDRKPDILEQIIRRSVELKIQVVEKDEKESEYRSLLNFGHTVGHAIEQLSQYQMKHGFAVAAGMLVAGVLSHQLMGYPASHLKRLRKTLNLFKLDDVKISKYALIDIWETIQTDKKARRKQPRFTLLDSNGQPLLFQAVSREALRNAVDVC
ncbi:MAG: 3-dehydroquinate synthase, partial [Calditrichaeota bacterium]|nr:3-dehydroquinate synthase [Calditrichota bacterium]